jgi:TolB-like protein
MALHRLGVALILLLLPSFVWAATPRTRTRVAILSIEAIQGMEPGTAKVLTNLISNRTAELGPFEVLSSTDVAAMLGFERQQQLLGCTDSSCLAEIGGALGADYLLSGQVAKVGTRFHLMLTLAEVRRARVVSRQSEQCEGSEDLLVDAAQRAVTSLFKPLLPPSPEGPSVVREPSEPPSRTPAFVLLAATTALAGGGVVSGVIAKQRYNDLERRLKDKQGADYQSTWNAGQRGIRDASLGADILYCTAAVAAGVTVWLFLRAPSPAPSAPAVSVSAGGHGVAVSLAGSF